jgi:N-acetylmuramoyl-L-alanine amidase
MLTQSRTNPPGYFSRIMILPLLFLLFCAFAFRLHKDGVTGRHPVEKNLTVVIDAGHGGFDPGTIAGGVQEKDLTLAIARKVKQFSAAYNVNVLLTRDADIMAGGKATKEEGLLYRTDFASEQHADLFVSIHINNAPDSARGMQVYLSSANAFPQKSQMLGVAMVEAMKKMFATQELLQRVENVHVLKATKMPAILIECGNLHNSDDLTFITNPENQDKVAKNILQGIVNYEGAAQ